MKRFIPLLGLVVLTACSDSTGPETSSVTGIWTYNAANLSDGAGFSCNVSGTRLTLTQSGNTFTGTYDGGVLSCTSGGQTIADQLGAGIIVGGNVTGGSVTFDFDNQNFRNTGTRQGSTITGSATIRFSSGTILVGNFSAIRS